MVCLFNNRNDFLERRPRSLFFLFLYEGSKSRVMETFQSESDCLVGQDFFGLALRVRAV